MDFLLLTHQLSMLAGGSIDGDKRPLDISEWLGVTFVGLGVVMLALVLLIIVITIFGKLFEALDGYEQKKKAKEAAEKAPRPSAVKAAPPAPAPKAAPVPAAVQEDEGEIIAAIMAAIAMMGEADGTVYQIRSVKPAGGVSAGRSAWAMDGRRQNVAPF